MLADGEFDIRTDEAGIEVWVTQMGDFMNMNTAWIDRENGVVAITDPFDSQRWVEALANEGLRPTHILYTHTHRDHTAGYAKMMELIPDIEVWGHHDSIHKSLLGRFVFGNVSLTNEWNHHPNSSKKTLRALRAFAAAVLKAGGFANVSNTAMVNRLIDLRLVSGAKYQTGTPQDFYRGEGYPRTGSISQTLRWVTYMLLHPLRTLKQLRKYRK